MIRTVFTLFIGIFFLGCASHTSLDQKIQNPEIVHIVTTKVQNIFPLQKSTSYFDRFPFILKNYDVRGKFSDDFYQRLNFIYTAKPIEEVDFWKLQKEAKSVDFIYVRPIWIKEYRKLSNDLFENICYSYNISKKEQDILKAWVAQGGKLWIESGTYSTKYDIFNKNGEIATKKINYLVKDSLRNVRFWRNPIKSYLFYGQNLDPINYVPSIKTFVVNTRASAFKDIKRLKIEVRDYVQNNFVILGEPLVVDTKRNPLVTLLKYKKGYVVSLLPFEYKDVYYDGELLRWRLLFYLFNLK